MLKLLSFIIFLFPLLRPLFFETVIFATMDCPACYVALGDAQHLKGARVYLLDHDHEINCILKKLHAIDPNLQLRFIDLLRKKQPTISLQDFSHKHDLDSSVFTECKDCKILTIGVKELSFYVMGKFITKVPKEH